MDQQQLAYLFKKYFDKTATSLEVKLLMENLHLASDEEIEMLMKGEFENYHQDDHVFFNPVEKERILKAVFKTEKPAQQSRSVKLFSNRSYFKYAAIAAVIFLTFTIGVLNLKDYNPTINVIDTTATSMLFHDRNKAILTLSDGTAISLNEKQNGEISHEPGIMVTKMNDGKLVYTDLQHEDYAPNNEPVYHTVATPRGAQFQVILPDGTKVWLNSASSIKYPTHFSEEVRSVVLQGEAYFEVAKNKAVPFKVYTDKQVLKVLGTHFNMSSYENSAVKTTLLEGSVEVSDVGRPEVDALKRVLKPGDQAVFNHDKLTVTQVDVSNAISWKSGFFQFENTDLKEVMDQFSRWYDAEFMYEGKIPDTKLWGRVSRDVNVTDALAILDYFNFKYRIDQKNGASGRNRIIIYQ